MKTIISFYNNSSSFVHGGLDTNNRDVQMAIGQKQIHNKIQQLNFRDCHAKITQVDSQSTLGNGVVVQVTGELSNAGQPMRRFTQTFVLASQSPKKYYVHNDIFRYQDYYSDEEIDENGRSEIDEETQDVEQVPVEQQQQQVVVQAQQQQVITQPPPPQQIYYQSNVLASGPAPVMAPNYQQPPPPVQQQQQQLPVTQQLNGLGSHEEPINQLTQQLQQTLAVAPIVDNAGTNQQTQLPPLHQIPAQSETQDELLRQDSINEQQSQTNDLEQDKELFDSNQDSLENQNSNEPKTYANLFKSGTIASGPPSMSFASTIGGPGTGNVLSQSSTVSPPPNKFNQEPIISRFDPPLGATVTQKPLAQRPIRGKFFVDSYSLPNTFSVTRSIECILFFASR